MSVKRKFVIHKHAASRLHYDFRLQVGDALLSWAVPKGLSTEANEKRLAIQVEDHELDYADFEGVIPEDEYGGGTVMIWDRGEYEALVKDGDNDDGVRDAIKEGSFKFLLYGKKLKGGYAMARTGEQGGKAQWVIFKVDDKYADARRNPTSTEPDSVATGRSIEEIESDAKSG